MERDSAGLDISSPETSNHTSEAMMSAIVSSSHCVYKPGVLFLMRSLEKRGHLLRRPGTRFLSLLQFSVSSSRSALRLSQAARCVGYLDYPSKTRRLLHHHFPHQFYFSSPHALL